MGFVVDNELKKVPLGGGQPTTICEIVGIAGGTAPRGANWGPDDTIAFNTGNSSGLSRVAAIASYWLARVSRKDLPSSEL